MKSKQLVLVLFVLFGLTLGAFAWSALPARAAPLASTYFVNGTSDPSLPGTCTLIIGGYSCPSLRAAVTAANANPGSEIVLTHGATYTLTATALGALHIIANMTIDYGGVICSINCPATIKGGAGWSNRILLVDSFANVQITSVTIRDGNVTADYGGGIYLTGSLTLTNSTVTNNIASNGGGGIYNQNGTLTLINTNIVSNTASGGGGGVFINPGTYLTLNASTLISNTATGVQSGGGLWTRGTVTITNSMINSNSASSGGGVYNGNGATMAITGSTVSGNITTNCCAGIYNTGGALTITNSSVINNTSGDYVGGVDNDSALVVMNSTISGNSAATSVGGIYNTGTLTMTNSTLSGNKANTDAGGLYNLATATLNNVTITNNTADNDNNGTGHAGGVWASSGALNLMNTLIGTNISQSGISPDCAGILTSQGYNLIGKTTNCTISGSLTGVISNTNPFIGPLANLGGATKTHALLAGSPAINNGNPGASDGIGNHCMPTDQRGVTRPVAGRCDIGAFEGTGAALFLPLILR